VFVNKIEQLKVQSEKNEVSFISRRFTQQKKTFVVSFKKIENDNLLRAKTKKKKKKLIDKIFKKCRMKT
jgi:hypothetical protein